MGIMELDEQSLYHIVARCQFMVSWVEEKAPDLVDRNKPWTSGILSTTLWLQDLSRFLASHVVQINIRFDRPGSYI